ncbi:MAG: NCS2 family permease [Methanobacteriaceae archaeon]|nr:NCS2 family permease [Methanobacteriaceae archaeon]
MGVIDYFKLKEHGTDVKTEILAGLTMFMAMAFMLIVATNILGEAGMNKEAVFAATALGAAITCFLLGTIYNKIYIAGPSTGIITYFTYTLVQGVGLPWEIGILAVICEAVILLILSLTNITEYILDSIPDTLKYGLTAGLGLLIAFIGLQGSGIIIANTNSLVGIGDFRTAQCALTIIGVLITGILMKRDVKGAILFGIIITYILGVLAEITGWYVVNPAIGDYSLIPTQIINLNVFSEFMNYSFNINNLGVLTSSTSIMIFFVVTVFIFLFIDLTSNLSTLIGVDAQMNKFDCENCNYEEKKSKLKEATLPAALGSIISGLLGTTTMVSYLESVAGVTIGGRTGFAAIITGICLLLCLLFSPLITILPQFVVAPAIIVVGMLMVNSIKDIDFSDASEGLPAFLTVILIPLTYDIGEGIIFGIISYVIIKVFSGNYKEIKLGTWILFVFMVIIFICIKIIYPV